MVSRELGESKREINLKQTQLIGSTVIFSWLAMQVVHEAGHMLHAWLTGGKVTRVVLHPLEISRTDVEPNPHPQFVAWGGPIWGSVWPLAVLGAVRAARWPHAWLAAFFAGFCLVANGAYLLGGAFYPAGDAEVLLQHGAPRGALLGFGVVATAGGFYLWNGLGKHFGWGQDAHPVDRCVVWGISAATAVVVLVEFLFI
jgi:hypothetical protein